MMASDEPPRRPLQTDNQQQTADKESGRVVGLVGLRKRQNVDFGDLFGIWCEVFHVLLIIITSFFFLMLRNGLSGGVLKGISTAQGKGGEKVGRWE